MIKLYSKKNGYYSYVIIDLKNKEFETFWIKKDIWGYELKNNELYSISNDLKENGYIEKQ